MLLLPLVFSLLALSSCWGGWVVMQLHLSFWFTLLLATLSWGWQYVRLRNPQIPHTAYGEIFRQNVWIGFITAGMITGL